MYSTNNTISDRNTAPSHKDSGHLLVIDDDTLFCDAVSCAGIGESFTVHTANTATSGLALCKQHKMDVVLLDQHLPDKNGSDICPAILSKNDQTKIILATAYPDLSNAVEVIKHGAFDYLAKPFDIDELSFAIKRAFQATKLEQVAEISSWKNRQEAESTRFIGSSTAAAIVRDAALLAARSNAPTLLTGATGTGKTLLAQYIHTRSDLRDKVFLSVNCAILPENLIEAELFGVEKGAFTDAHSSRRGIFEMASGGTLFLDEIGTLPHHLQAKLLGVLDDGRIKRLGSETDRKVDVRIITATNSNLIQGIQNGTFREDLYYRLSVLTIELPALAKRCEDLQELSQHFLSPAQAETISDDEYTQMAKYHWPGNVRELKNILERAALLKTEDVLTPSQFLGSTPHILAPSVFSLSDSHEECSLKEMEKEHIARTLKKFAFNRSKAARSLDISRSTLLRKIKQYSL
jgi:DNA-binding NtrC family response regulator